MALVTNVSIQIQTEGKPGGPHLGHTLTSEKKCAGKREHGRMTACVSPGIFPSSIVFSLS